VATPRVIVLNWAANVQGMLLFCPGDEWHTDPRATLPATRKEGVGGEVFVVFLGLFL
jgi:hypothetical protein